MRNVLVPMAIAALVSVVAGSARDAVAAAKATSVELPAPFVTLKDGPHRDLAEQKCLLCHGSEYIYYQPALTRPQWTGEVNKMKSVYAAPIAPEEVVPLVDYLMSQNGKI